MECGRVPSVRLARLLGGATRRSGEGGQGTGRRWSVYMNLPLPVGLFAAVGSSPYDAATVDLILEMS
jgi:hypothetical protein